MEDEVDAEERKVAKRQDEKMKAYKKQKNNKQTKTRKLKETMWKTEKDKEKECVKSVKMQQRKEFADEKND